jgi:hypothetical protein
MEPTEYEDEMLRLLDQAIMSDDPRIKNILKKLLVTVALCEDPNKESAAIGPIQRMSNNANHITMRLSAMEMRLHALENRLTVQYPNPGYTMWPHTTTGTSNDWPPGSSIDPRKYWTSSLYAEANTQTSSTFSNHLTNHDFTTKIST